MGKHFTITGVFFTFILGLYAFIIYVFYMTRVSHYTMYTHFLECYVSYVFLWFQDDKNKTNDNKDMYFMTNPNLFIEIHTLAHFSQIFILFSFPFVYSLNNNGYFFFPWKYSLYILQTLNVICVVEHFKNNNSYIVGVLFFETIFFSIILLTFFGIISVWAHVSTVFACSKHIYVYKYVSCRQQ